MFFSCAKFCVKTYASLKLVVKTVPAKHQPSKRQFSKAPPSKSENLCWLWSHLRGAKRAKSVRAFSFQARGCLINRASPNLMAPPRYGSESCRSLWKVCVFSFGKSRMLWLPRHRFRFRFGWHPYAARDRGYTTPERITWGEKSDFFGKMFVIRKSYTVRNI